MNVWKAKFENYKLTYFIDRTQKLSTTKKEF